MLEQYIVLDLETTGLSPEADRILEIALIRVEKGQITERFETFVNPHRKIPVRITELTGITEEMIQGAPEIEEVFPKLLSLMGDLPVVGHNISFDYNFLKVNATKLSIPFEMKAIDTLALARKVLPELPSRSLEFLCTYFGITRCRAHRALDDVCETRELFEILVQRFCEGQEEWLIPQPLFYRVRKTSPITPSQKRYLTDLIRMHGLTLDVELETLTKSEASRRIDQILATYGR